MHVKGVRKVARANPMARNQHRRAQEALFSPAPSTIPPEEKKAAERTETPETDVSPIAPDPSPADYISRQYGIVPNCTNVPRLLYAILCEVVRGRK
jgi:hypothetical protein